LHRCPCLSSCLLLQITALQIAALKKIGRGSKILLVDRYGNASKAVAKELSRRGFGRVFVVAGARRDQRFELAVAGLRQCCCIWCLTSLPLQHV
jgi:hypothetical protein